MNHRHRLAYRAALAIHRRHVPPPALPELFNFSIALSSCLRRLKQIELAQSRRFDGAAARLFRQFRTNISRIHDDTWEIEKRLANPNSENRFASVADLMGDLLALESEFEAVEISLRKQTISVETPPIVLQGIELGPFRVTLDWSQLEYPDYSVEARVPNPAKGDGGRVTHPHVLSASLCEGDGQPAIRKALRSGRLLDFFLLVDRILATYNDNSAHVRLEEWKSPRCSDCGGTCDPDDASSCADCHADLCDTCGGRCRVCGSWFCSSCTSSCSVCLESICDKCRKPCPDCDDSGCPNCIEGKHAQEHSTEEEPDDDQASSPEPAEVPAADPALQPLGVGEAAVPA